MRRLLPLVGLGLAQIASAQSLFLDLNTSPPPPPSSNPEQLVHVNGRTFFAAVDHAGQEPWVTDGTSAGTFRVADIGLGAGASVPDGFAALPDGRVVFAAYDYSDREPWISDGTAAGTIRLRDVKPGAASSLPGPFVSFAGAVYFLADDGVHGRELWRTDGTEAGTTLVKDIFPVPASTAAPTAEIRAAGGSLYFGMHLLGTGVVLAKSDGTAAGTSIVKALNAEPFGLVDQMIDFSGTLLFRAKHPTLGSELWRSDGTSAGTFVITDLNAGSASSLPSGLFEVGGKVVFAATEPTVGRELFVTDGTAAGTALLENLNPNPSLFDKSSDPIGLGVVGSRLVLSAYQPGIGRELFATDGTAAGTSRIGDLWPGSSWSSPSGGATLNGKLYFAANDGVAGIELFETDGTIGGTQRISDLSPGFDGFPIEHITAAGSLVLFTKNDGVHGEELFASDGTPGNTGLLKDIFEASLSSGSDPTELTRVGDRMFFVANPTLAGSALYSTDGTTAGTQVVVSGATTPALTSFITLTPFRDGLFFFAASPFEGIAPYFTDGTTAGTVKLASTSSCFVSDVAVLDDLVFFQAIDGLTFDVHQYVSDGTVAGTMPLTAFDPFIGADAIETLGDEVLVSGFWPGAGMELIATDGTDAGTRLVKDIHPGIDDSFVFSIVRAGSRAFFRATDGVHGDELWVSDGTTSGTTLIADLTPGPASTVTFALAPLGDRLVFDAFDVANGHRVFVTDGTAAGTTPILTLPAGQSIAFGFSGNDEVLLFTVNDGTATPKLWRTDGTAAGTIAIPSPGLPSFSPFIADIGTDRELVIGLIDRSGGVELHHTADGSTAPALVAEIASGPHSASPSDIERFGDRVFVVADDGLHGRELHVLPLIDFDAFVAESFGSGCAPSGSPLPTIAVVGDATASAPFSIEAASLPISAPALVVFGANAGATPIGFGCALRVAFPFFTFASATNSSGSLQLPVPSNPGFAGLHFHLQVLASGIGGAVSATPGFELVIGN